ncbi:hypothetical protein Q4566_01720 [Tamlana sp. 2_MG-2023]|uniref:hypothetical protein n=1 Tax=unclassified Tamlana TaxID=2614803 RepID=UPI0026E3FA8A|nr:MULTISPECIES: hypothetical protein [unclassified Tamlana]MDO6758902.1 hypothetical protein [Tamlana sp. 2_MG-2023]MDO6789601.1 hypothetical protein [Tamlana sp. 1_MG-2023]
MKLVKLRVLVTACMLCSVISFSQSIEGNLSVKGVSKTSSIKQNSPVELFKAFKTGVYTINFNFKSNAKPDQFVLFDMKTVVKYNGKTVSTTSRANWPWLPGDMFVPIEAFDAIPVLQKLSDNGRSFKKGSYEITFQLTPSSGQKVKGSIRPFNMKFNVK